MRADEAELQGQKPEACYLHLRWLPVDPLAPEFDEGEPDAEGLPTWAKKKPIEVNIDRSEYLIPASQLLDLVTKKESTQSKPVYPWGTHYTKNLEHLSAAAVRFWKEYDKNEIDTAPKNEDISSWLVKERKVSKTLADAMASILRVDGLPVGPRKK